MEQKKAFLWATLVLASLLFMAPAAFSALGASLTPSAGAYSFPKEGGRMDFLVTNYGDESILFKAQMAGEASAFASIDKQEVVIAPKSTQKFTVSIFYTSPVVGKEYPLTLTVSGASSSGASTTVSSNVRISFSDSAGSRNYVVANVGKEEGILSTRLFTFFTAALLVGLAYYLIRTRGPWKD